MDQFRTQLGLDEPHDAGTRGGGAEALGSPEDSKKPMIQADVEVVHRDSAEKGAPGAARDEVWSRWAKYEAVIWWT